jgi:hypothetical protein
VRGPKIASALACGSDCRDKSHVGFLYTFHLKTGSAFSALSPEPISENWHGISFIKLASEALCLRVS